MIEIAGLPLLRPEWALAVPLALLMGLLLARRAGALAGWDRAVDPALMTALHRLGRVVPGKARARNWPPAAAAALIALALVGPAQESRDGAGFRNLDGVVIAIDLSRSMAESGGLDGALLAARLVAERAGARSSALIVYAGDAYLASAFTSDARALGATIAHLDAETVPDQGSRPERALALARQTLDEAGVLAGDVVLLSDGGGLDEPAALQEAEAISDAGGRVSTLLIDGGDRQARAAPEALAEAGDGLAAAATDPTALAEALSERPATRLAESPFATLFWVDYGRYLLGFALIPALLMFRRRA